MAFLGGRGEVLKPDGGPVVTVMDFSRSFPLDPLPSGWRHRKFWTKSPMTIYFAVKDGMPSMRFETHDSVDAVSLRQCRSRRLSNARLALVHRVADQRPARRTDAGGDDHPARLFLRFLTDRGEKRAMEVIWAIG
jgi:hypothetical protein